MHCTTNAEDSELYRPGNLPRMESIQWRLASLLERFSALAAQASVLVMQSKLVQRLFAFESLGCLAVAQFFMLEMKAVNLRLCNLAVKFLKAKVSKFVFHFILNCMAVKLSK